MLIVMEDRDIQHFLQFGLNIKAFGGFNIFEVDTAKAGGDSPGYLNNYIRVVRIDLNIKHVHIRERLKQNTFAFHNGFRSQRAAVSQPQDGSPIRNYRHEVTLGGVLIGKQGVLFNFEDWPGNAGSIGEAQIILVIQRFGRYHGDFARNPIQMMVFECSFFSDCGHNGSFSFKMRY